MSEPFPPTALRRRHDQRVRNSSSSYKIDFLNPKGYHLGLIQSHLGQIKSYSGQIRSYLGQSQSYLGQFQSYLGQIQLYIE